MPAAGLAVESDTEILPSRQLETISETVVYEPALPVQTSGQYLLSIKGPASIQVNEAFVCEITLTARQDFEEALVQQKIEDGLEYVKSDPPAAQKQNYIYWKFPAMKAGESATLKVTYIPNRKSDFELCAKAQVIVNECVTVRATQPKIAISKTGQETAIMGEEIPYTISVRNEGDGIARDVVLYDFVPNGLRHASGTSKLVNNLGTLGPGETKVITIILKAVAPGTHCNKAVVETSNAGRAKDDAYTKIMSRDIRLVKTGPAMEYFKKRATYSIVVENTADSPLTDIQVRDTLPPYTRLLGAPGGTIEGNTVLWVIPRLDPGQKQRFSLVLTCTTGGIHTNTVDLTTREGLRRRAYAPTLWRGFGAILLEVIDTDDPLQDEVETTYIIKVTNQGTANDRNIKIKAEFPFEIVPLAVKSPVKGWVQDKVVQFEPYLQLAPKQTIEYQIRAKGKEPGDGRVKVYLTSDLLRTPVVEEESTHVY